MHIRRHFLDVIKAVGSVSGAAKSDTAKIIEWIGQVYYIEDVTTQPPSRNLENFTKN